MLTPFRTCFSRVVFSWTTSSTFLFIGQVNIHRLGIKKGCRIKYIYIYKHTWGVTAKGYGGSRGGNESAPESNMALLAQLSGKNKTP